MVILRPAAFINKEATMPDQLIATHTLTVNQALDAATRPLKLLLQGDGNLTLYRTDSDPWRALWTTPTWKRPITKAVMQADGNFVLVGTGPFGTEVPYWDTKTWGHPGARLVLLDDGAVVIYDQRDALIWSSETIAHWPSTYNRGILHLDRAPPVSEHTDPTWSAEIVDSRQWLAEDPPEFAWTQVTAPGDEFDAPPMGACGRAIVLDPDVSGDDFPFHHPFGNDWECYLEMDGEFINLLARHNDGSGPDLLTGNDYTEATAQAPGAPHWEAHAGVLGIEWESRCIPPAFRPTTNDRVAVFGRWIVDAAHRDFHTEIHPPLLLALARQSPTGDTTQSTVISRPYLVSERWGEGSARSHLADELRKAALFVSQRLEAHPRVFNVPFKGHHELSYVLRPPGPGNGHLVAQYSFTVRSGVGVRLARVANDALRVTITLDEHAYSPTAPALPPRLDRNIDVDSLIAKGGAGAEEGLTILRFLETLALGIPEVGVPFDAHLEWVLSRGILTDSYDLAPAPFVSSGGEVHDVNNLPEGGVDAEAAVDNRQPWPVFGTITLGWAPTPSPDISIEPQVLPLGTATLFTVTARDHWTDSELQGAVYRVPYMEGADKEYLGRTGTQLIGTVNGEWVIVEIDNGGGGVRGPHGVHRVWHQDSLLIEVEGYPPAEFEPLLAHMPMRQ